MTDNTEKVDLLSMTPDEVAEFLSSLGEPKYRAKQIFGWMHRGEDFDGMTNIPKKLRETLKGNDTEAIKADTEAVEKAFYKISEKLYQQQAGAQGADPNMGGNEGNGGSDGTYYNANYEDHSNNQ